jgi:pyruvate dehydrogenase (quinone)
VSRTVSDHLIDRLAHWGVRRIYGYPGDGAAGILAALQRSQRGIGFVQTRHEEMAAFMACGHAKFTGEVGVCVATSGPGAIHLLNGLYDAKFDHQPVVALVGQTSRHALGGSYQQEVDLPNLFKDVASEYVQTCMHPAQLRHLVDRAMRIAKSERTVTCIVFPKDVQELDAIETPKHAHDTIHSSAPYSTPRVLPNDADLDRAAEILNAGKRVAMLVGAGALGAGQEVLAVADALGAGVAKALLGRCVVPDTIPFVTGSIGLLGTQPSAAMMAGCDTLLMVGSSFPYSEFLPKEGQARGVQIDLDGRMLGLRYPMELNLQGDSKETLRALLPRLARKTDRSWQQRIEANVRDWWDLLDQRAHVRANPINPQRLFWSLSQRLPDRAIVTCDSGTSAAWFARDLKVRDGMMASISGNLATMGCAVPYAIAAKFAFPDRPVIACVGDGAMQMDGSAELITAAKYRGQWSDPRLIFLVLNNRDLNMVTWELRAMSGDPKFPSSQDVPDFEYAAYAQLIGLDGVRIASEDVVDEAWDRALSADRPFVLDAVCDPDVPILPPHITIQQAKAFAEAVLKGDPDRAGIVRQALWNAFPGLAPRA